MVIRSAIAVESRVTSWKPSPPANRRLQTQNRQDRGCAGPAIPRPWRVPAVSRSNRRVARPLVRSPRLQHLPRSSVRSFGAPTLGRWPATDAPIWRCPHGATARRSGADDPCSPSGPFRVSGECARSKQICARPRSNKPAIMGPWYPCPSIAGRPRALEGTSRAHPCCQPPAHRASPGRRTGTGRCFPLQPPRLSTRRPGLDPDLGARRQSHQRHGRGRHRGRGLDRLTRVPASGSS